MSRSFALRAVLRLQACLSGQFHFSSSASSAVSAAVRGGPVKVVYTNLSRPSYTLVSIKPEITSAKDLIGKKIAVNSFGDTGHLATILYLKKMGVNPASVLVHHRRPKRSPFPALRSGVIDASPLAMRDVVLMKDQKHTVLADLGKEIQLVWNGVAVSDKTLAENPQLVERFLRALAKGREFARRHREETIAFISKRDPTPIEAIKVDYDVTKASDDRRWVSARRSAQAGSGDSIGAYESRQGSGHLGRVRLHHHEKKLCPVESCRLAAGSVKS